MDKLQTALKEVVIQAMQGDQQAKDIFRSIKNETVRPGEIVTVSQ